LCFKGFTNCSQYNQSEKPLEAVSRAKKEAFLPLLFYTIFNQLSKGSPRSGFVKGIQSDDTLVYFSILYIRIVSSPLTKPSLLAFCCLTI
jgi:hypothetical protein